jgi:hypothetical protein
MKRLHHYKGNPLGKPSRRFEMADQKIGSQQKRRLNMVEIENRPDHKGDVQKGKGHVKAGEPGQ